MRAGLVTDMADVSHIIELVNNVERGFVVVNTEPADRESRDIIEQFVEAAGKDRVIVSLEKEIEAKEEIEDKDIRIPQPRHNEDNSGGDQVNLSLKVIIILNLVKIILR